MKTAATSVPLLSLLLLLCGGMGAAAQAQQVYRTVGPDGRVTFSDRPPVDAKQPQTATVGGGTSAAASDTGAGTLPYALQQVATRFPVTLYTGKDCAPCASARNLLVARGVPFTERTVASNEDIDALKQLSGSTSLPFGTIGGQRLEGFSDVEWTQYLDAAGYPKQSQLPAGYRRPAAQPLVASVEKAPAPADGAARSRTAPPRAPQQAPAPTRASPSNPAGISF